MTPALGMCFHREAPAAEVVAQAQAAETLGYDEFWVIEDCFYTAGVSLAAAALTTTEAIGVGIGIMPAVARNPAITAMEIATLGSLGRGRFHAGIGHGVQEWMEQMGARVASPVTVLEETISAVCRLLDGEELTHQGRYHAFDRVQLDAPPDPRPLVSAGVRGPRSLALSGRVADGTILADFCSPAYLEWARREIDGGEGHGDGHRITVFCSGAVAPDGAEARTTISHFLAEVCADAPLSLRMAPDFDEMAIRAERTCWLDTLQAMPASWWRQIGPIGTPDDAAAYLVAMGEAGADCLALFPSPVDPITDAGYVLDSVASALGRG